MSSKAPATMALSNTLIARIFPSLEKLSALKFVILALLGTGLLALSAKVSIPFYPLPITMQTLAVISLGCLYGSRLALATVLLYLFEGAMGLPIFQGGGGILYMMGPTGGYLLGFALSAFVVGFLSEKGLGRTLNSSLLLFVIGAVLIDTPGLYWLSTLVGVEATKTIYLSYQYAFLLKTGLGAVAIPALWHHHIIKKEE